ncbi:MULTISPECIES: diguanylate cyclase [Caloramator]|uniref:PAS domain S-box-containing protein/diguanylate cyclase (GGDEF) domain-containing protein n=1 Tax=Caloramator proteoclasticus DSM 10124 TaxID=1121262 RepID=A0A1M4Y1R6_9CLOT|nr:MULTISPECIES: diguanylate cyclase [Caloramator]SHE99619.1 PAS domain S-box-containing protein/diguanylate cyclase (GGDEF) domain-containing protein [Caloramator proteoclasticus DSM 10124]
MLANMVLEKIIDKMQNAFAYHKIIYDEAKNPVDYEYIYVNKSFEELTGLKKQYVIGAKVTELIPNIKESSFNWIEYYAKIAENETEDHIEQYFDIWDRWYRIDVFSPEKGYFATLFNDITDIKKTTESLREQKEVLNQITENLEEATFLQDVNTKEVIYASTAFEKIYEMSIEEMKKDVQKWKQMVHPDDYEKVQKRYNMDVTLKEMYEKGIFVEKFRIITNSGKLKWIKSKFLPIKNEQGEIIRVVGIEQDITRDIENKLEIIRQKVKAENLAMRDYLTNLYNRRAFFQLAEERCKKAKCKDNNLVLVMADIDKFKSINDNFGHDVGDLVLKNFADVLKSSVRGNDIVARFGGEEFIILLNDIDVEQAYKRIEEVRKRISETEITVLDKKVKYTASFGISKVNCCGFKYFEEAIKRADIALYRAKENGRNRVEIID